MGCASLMGRHDKPESWGQGNAVIQTELKRKKKKQQETAPNIMSWSLLNVPFERREQNPTVELHQPCPGASPCYSGSIELPVGPGKGPKTCLLPQIYCRSMELLRGTRSCSSAAAALHRQPLRQPGRQEPGGWAAPGDAPLPRLLHNSLFHHPCSGTGRGTRSTQCCNKTCQSLAKLWESSAWLWWEV